MPTFVPVPYRPSSPITGSEYAIFRGRNMLLRGQIGQMYYEQYPGSENLDENYAPVAITGTISFSPSSNVVEGVGTAFLDELHIGQMLQASDGEPLVVQRIVDDETFVNARTPTSTASGVTAKRLFILGELDIQRFAKLRGNAVRFDKGTILDVGDGVLYVNGAVLPGDSLTSTRRAQVALYNAATQTYDVQPVGFDDVPTGITVAVTGSGGVKNMSPGYYSFRAAYYSTVTDGYGNPSATILSGGTAGYQVTAANSTFTFNFSADTPPPNAAGYILYGSSFGGSSAQSQINAIQGGWFEFQRVPFTDLVADQISVEYTDNDLGDLVTFDNDSPPDAEFVTTLDRYPFLVSTNGQGVGSGDREASTSPGAFVSPIKAENFDAYPSSYKVPTEKGETIIGCLGAAGRIFVLTANTLQAVTATGLPSAPFTCRPFWRRGFANPYNLCFVDDTLYGFTTAGMFRSIATGDEGAESHEFAASVDGLTADWSAGYEFTQVDNKNELVCFFQSGIRQNDEGYWETDILPYSLRINDWMPKIVLSDPTRDMIVSGVANVNGHLEFIAGGRREGTTDRCDTFRLGTGTGGESYYLAWTFQDGGAELIAKWVRKIRAKGRFAAGATVQVYGVTADTDIDITDLENGANPVYEFDLDASTEVHQYAVQKLRARNLLMFTLRLAGTGDGADRFDEFAVDVTVGGQQR